MDSQDHEMQQDVEQKFNFRTNERQIDSRGQLEWKLQYYIIIKSMKVYLNGLGLDSQLQLNQVVFNIRQGKLQHDIFNKPDKQINIFIRDSLKYIFLFLNFFQINIILPNLKNYESTYVEQNIKVNIIYVIKIKFTIWRQNQKLK
ncbi:hypothetical protein pb186bvf_003170 [Paramecium bursaria]